MITAVVTNKFGLIASDSTQYDTSKGELSFETPRLFYSRNNLIAFIGTPLYFSRIDKEKLNQNIPGLALYLTNYLKEVKPEVEKIMKSEIADKDEQKPHFCLFVMGLHKGLPTLVQFNSFLKFGPRYLYTANGEVKFSTILYGDDNPEKKKVFKESTEYMKKKAESIEHTPGLLGEILTRGIYKKADLEQKIGDKKKYVGGVVSVAGIDNTGRIFSLSGIQGV